MNNINWRTKLKQTKINVTKTLKEPKTNPKIKRIRTEMKTNIYNQFQFKGTIDKNQNFHYRNQE